jgi:cell wall-associated NlpC family hydrolase
VPKSDVQKRWQSVYEDVIGLPYRLGGKARKGFDCSGLVQYVYEKYDGRRLPRTTGDLFHCGVAVKQGSLSAGDLVFYRTRGKGPSHVGIYLWSGWFLHAANGEGVTLTRLDDPYYEARFLGARRL